jgi:hypothetical protein
MLQQSLFFEGNGNEHSPTALYSLGGDLYLDLRNGPKGHAIVYRHSSFIKAVDLSDKVAKKLFVVEVVNDLGAQQTKLADVLKISRQTIHNYLQSYKYFGKEGLVYGYNPDETKNLAKQRTLHADQLPRGNKAEQVAAIRAEQREQESAVQMSLNFSFGDNDRSEEVADEEQPFSEQHDWESSRYAGVFIYWIPLIVQSHWLQLIMGHFGAGWRIFSVFLLMAGLNIRSIEQMKHVRSAEAGMVLSLGTVPSRSTLWTWFYEVAKQGLARTILDDYFRLQIRAGLVGYYIWFTDGHLLPYTGKQKVHYSYNTQRRMPVPGRTSQVTCDHTGRIVDFVIDEGKGEMKQRIIEVVDKWLPEMSARPISVFDREGYDKAFFSQLVKAEQPFVTWDKNVDIERLVGIDDQSFTLKFTFNGKRYSVFEEEKTFSHTPANETEPHTFALRHLIIWNRSSNRRTCGLAYGSQSTEDAVRAILSRWGASENTFKHIQGRHPLHYHPGFTLIKSERQEIANPEIKEKEKLITRLCKGIAKLHRKLFNAKEQTNKDGTPRSNSQRQRLHKEIQQKEAELERAHQEKKRLPEKVDVSKLEDYCSFKRIDNEGKYLFDFVTTAVWNARKQMVDWLRDYYEYENDLVDLFYAITKSHGWVRSTATEVTVRLEPLQQVKRCAAQEQLCRKLTAFGAQTPTGKRLVVEVGESPLK